MPTLGTRLVPNLSQGEFAFQLRLSEGTPLTVTADTVGRIEGELTDDPRFERIFSTIGSLPSTASGRRTLGENLAQIDVLLPEGADAEAEAAAVERVRRVLARFPRIESELVHPSVLSVKPPIGVRVFSDDLALLDQAAGVVKAQLEAIPGIEDVGTTSEPGSPEVQVELDRERAATLGLTATDIAQSLRRKIGGEIVGEFREGEERIDIRLRSLEPFRDRASEVANLRLRLPDGTVVPVSAVAEVVVGRGPAAIYRAEGARMAEVTAEAAASDLGSVIERVRAETAYLVQTAGMAGAAPDATDPAALPQDVRIEMAGQDEELKLSFDSLKLALGLAVFLVYVVMAGQFESLIHPFVILTSVPLGVVGIVAALALTGHSITVLVLIGAVDAGRHRGEQRDRPRRRHQSAATGRGPGARRRLDRRRPGAAAADPHDHGDDRARLAADGARPRGRRRVVGGIIAWGASMVGPGRYQRTSSGGFTLGCLEGDADERCDELGTILECIGPVQITENLRGARWSKLAINCAISSLGTVGGDRLGNLLAHRFVRRLALEVMTETVEVARKEEVQLEKVAGTLNLEKLALTTQEKTASGSASLVKKHALLLAVGARYRRLRSSMLAAIERGRRPAVDYLNGEVVSRADRHGIAVPVNDILQRTVHRIADGELRPGIELLRRIYDDTRPPN